jgi:hypothetical protein
MSEPTSAVARSGSRLLPLALTAILAGGGVFGVKRDGSLRSEISSRDESLEHLRGELATSAAEVSASQVRAADASASLAKIEQAAASARADAEAAKRRAADLADKLGETESARARAEKRAASAEAVIDALHKKKVNVERLAGLVPMPRISATVVEVDDSELPPVALLNGGEKEGLAEGDVLYVVRDGREVVRLAVERVRGDITAARVLRAARGERVRVGDVVTSTPP